MLRAWLEYQGLLVSPELISEFYAWVAVFASALFIVAAWVWVVFLATPYYRRLPRLCIPICTAWAYALATLPLMWRESTWSGCVLNYGWELLGPPALTLMLLYRCRATLKFSLGFAIWVSVSTAVFSVIAYSAAMYIAWRLLYCAN